MRSLLGFLDSAGPDPHPVLLTRIQDQFITKTEPVSTWTTETPVVLYYGNHNW